MFTQCSKCETIFRLSADALRAAGGQVRCGRCGEVFNALARLAEDPSGFVKGESPLDLETRADEILESMDLDLDLEPPDGLLPDDAAPPQAGDENHAAAPGVEMAQLQFLDPLDDDPSLEFTLPPGELDRIFVQDQSPYVAFTVDSDAASDSGAASVGDVPIEGNAPAEAAACAGLEVSEDVRHDMLSSYAHAELPEINAPRRRLPLAVWIGAAVVLALALTVQIIRGNQEWFAAHLPFLSGSAAAPVNLAAYQMRQWGVTGDPGAKGTLRVRASIMNVAAQLQPYPLLRVTLANRFGTRVGAREFEPREYMGQSPARMFAPGERVDAVLDILDPGKDAEGFEIDVCVRTVDKKIRCSGDAAGRAK